MGRLDPIVALDARVAAFLAAHREPGLAEASVRLTLLGKEQVVIVLALAAVALFLLWRRRHLVVPLLVALGGDHVTVQLIKHLVARPRPGADIAYYLETSSSFPSGNSAIAVAFYGFLAYAAAREVPTRTRRAAVALAGLLMALALGLSRVYLGVHFLTDVLAGYLVGLLWLIIGIRLAESLRPGPSAAGDAGPRPTRARLAMTSAVIVLALAFCVVFAARYVPPRAVADDPSAVTDLPTARE